MGSTFCYICTVCNCVITGPSVTTCMYMALGYASIITQFSKTEVKKLYLYLLYNVVVVDVVSIIY